MAASPGPWNPKQDPIVKAGPPGTGLHITKSGRLVDGSTGMYTTGVTAAATARANANAPSPAGTDASSTGGYGGAAVGALTGTGTPALPATQAPVDIGALRTMLVKYGYNIPTDGDTAGPLFKAALKDFLRPDAQHPVGARLMSLLGIDKGHLAPGLRNPKGFNQKFGLLPGGKTSPPTKIPASRLTGYGDQTPADVAATYGDSDTPPAVDLTGLDGLYAIASRLGTRIDPALADKLAGLEYDPQIHDEGVLQQRQGRDAAQSLHDIEHWYEQAGAAQRTAAERDHAISTAGVGSVKDAVASIVGSLGGSANGGSGMVGAAGADAAGTLAALGANEDQYNADLAPLLKAEAAGAHSRQSARNTSDAQDIAQKLVDLQGARGQSKAKYGLDITQENNTLDQQRFQDMLSLEQAREAAALTGAKILDANTKATAAGAKPKKGSFGASSSTDRTNYTKDLLSQIAPNGQLAKGMTRSKATMIASRLATIYFPHGGVPNGTGLIASILKQAGL